MDVISRECFLGLFQPNQNYLFFYITFTLCLACLVKCHSEIFKRYVKVYEKLVIDKKLLSEYLKTNKFFYKFESKLVGDFTNVFCLIL